MLLKLAGSFLCDLCDEELGQRLPVPRLALVVLLRLVLVHLHRHSHPAQHHNMAQLVRAAYQQMLAASSSVLHHACCTTSPGNRCLQPACYNL